MTLFVVQARGEDAGALERAVFIKDGFSWGAFVFAQLWLLYRRLWLPLIVWVVLEAAFFLLVLPHVSTLAAGGVDFVAHLFLGFEGNRMRLAKGARRATFVDVVEARDRNAAEASFFGRQFPRALEDGA